MAATGTCPDFFNYKHINVADYEYMLHFHCLLENTFPNGVLHMLIRLLEVKLEAYMAATGSPSNLHRNTIDGATGSLFVV